MDFNQTARNTLNQVQAELAQGKDQISWTIYEPITNPETYRQETKKYYAFRVHLKIAYLTAIFAIGLFFISAIFFALMKSATIWEHAIISTLLISLACAAWLEWKISKEKARELQREYFVCHISADFKKQRLLASNDTGRHDKLKFKQDIMLPAFSLPSNATPQEIAQRDSVQNELIKKMGVHFVERKIW